MSGLIKDSNPTNNTSSSPSSPQSPPTSSSSPLSSSYNKHEAKSTNYTDDTSSQVIIKDIDLIEDVITLHNPHDHEFNLSGFTITDDRGKNTTTIKEAVVAPQSNLYIYCNAKDAEKRKLRTPYIFWTNKNGKNRMKNVLNNDGDKILLMDHEGNLVANFAKDKQVNVN